MTPPAPPTDLARDADALVARLVAAYPAEADPATARVVHAPGRVNLIGEHTDYNEGFVLPVAIDLGISLALVPTDDRRVDVTLAATGERDGFDLDAIGAKRSSWIDYVAGTAWALLDAGEPVTGFRAVLVSDLPQGSGLSSSAALELASSLALSGGDAPGRGPDDARPARPAGRERVRRRQLRADGPVRVRVRRARERAAARLPDAGASGRAACRSTRRRSSCATAARRGGWSPRPTTSGARSARPRSRRSPRSSPG